MDDRDLTTRRDLDPPDWEAFRRVAHDALDGMVDYLQAIRDRPVWVEPPPAVRAALRQPLPEAERDLSSVLADVDRLIKPYGTGNLHPAFMGWVHGAGTPAGMIADMIAAGLNINCAGRNHVGIDVEHQITLWMAELFGFPEGTAGLFVTGTSMANFLALLVARNASVGDAVRQRGLAGGPPLCAYASAQAHGCIARAMEMAGLGSDQLRRVSCDAAGRIDLDKLAAAVAEDRRAGRKPFLVVGTAGSVDTGAIDDLAGLSDFAKRENLWFHVDGAFGALAMLVPTLQPLLAGIERADSIAFDFHKWLHVPYDAGFVLVRDGDAQRRTFASRDRYLARAERGLAAGDLWPYDLGPDLSRGFRALKTWVTLQTFGTRRLGHTIQGSCELARTLEERVRGMAHFRVCAPVTLNIVCFSLTGPEADARNRALVEHLHVSGQAAPSITVLDGQAVIRAAINNHRTTAADIDRFVADLEAARALLFGASTPETRGA